MDKEKFIESIEQLGLEFIDHGSKVTVCIDGIDMIISSITTTHYQMIYDFIQASTERAGKLKNFKDHAFTLLFSDEVSIIINHTRKKLIDDLVYKIMVLAKEMNQFDIDELNKLSDFLTNNYSIETTIDLNNLK